MSLNYALRYPANSTPPDANYTYGSAINSTAPGAKNGSPFEKDYINDILGFQQALLDDASIVPSGVSDTAANSQFLQALRNIIAQLAAVSADTLAEVIASTDTNKIFEGVTITIGDRANGLFKVVTLASLGGSPLNGFDEIELVGLSTLALKLRIIPKFNDAEQYGVIGDDDGTGATGTDNTAALQRAIVAPGDGSYTVLDGTKKYRLDEGFYIPETSTLDPRGGQLISNASGTGRGQTTRWENGVSTGPVGAVTLGDETVVGLNRSARFINFDLRLSNKAATGVVLYGTIKSEVDGSIEGLFQPFDGTRTNLGVLIRGSALHSNFANVINVKNNHMHDGVLVENYGVANTQPTGNTIFAGSNFGDAPTDNTGTCITFADSTIAAQSQGTKVISTNLEAYNIGIYFGEHNDGIDVNARFEGSVAATSRALKYSTGANPPTNITVTGSGLDAAQIGAVAIGIEGFAGGSNRIYDSKGSTREAGTDVSFAGIAPPIFATNILHFLYKDSAVVNFRTRDDGTGTGQFTYQPGGLSGGFGAFLRLHGHSHATAAGDVHIGPSNTAGKFRVKSGLAGIDRMIVDSTSITPGTDNQSSFGTAPLRATEVFAVNNVINTSDARFKTKVKPLTKNEIKASKEILQLLGGWQWLAKVEKEGDAARIHYGCTVQSVMKILESYKIDPFSKSFICYDKWDDEYQTFPAEYEPLLDDKGDVVKDKDGNPKNGKLISEERTEHTIKAGDSFSFRQNELTFFLLAGISARLDAAGI